jgi:hypothetical protein
MKTNIYKYRIPHIEKEFKEISDLILYFCDHQQDSFEDYEPAFIHEEHIKIYQILSKQFSSTIEDEDKQTLIDYTYARLKASDNTVSELFILAKLMFSIQQITHCKCITEHIIKLCDDVPDTAPNLLQLNGLKSYCSSLLGEVYQTEGNFHVSTDHFIKAKLLDPDNITHLMNIGINMLHILGKQKEVDKDLLNRLYEVNDKIKSIYSVNKSYPDRVAIKTYLKTIKSLDYKIYLDALEPLEYEMHLNALNSLPGYEELQLSGAALDYISLPFISSCTVT